MFPIWWWDEKHVTNFASSIAFLALVVGWLVAMIQAGRGKTFKLPVLGQIAERIALGVKKSGG
jgi:uncharacterized membrane protein